MTHQPDRHTDSYAAAYRADFGCDPPELSPDEIDDLLLDRNSGKRAPSPGKRRIMTLNRIYELCEFVPDWQHRVESTGNTPGPHILTAITAITVRVEEAINAFKSGDVEKASLKLRAMQSGVADFYLAVEDAKL